MIVVVCSAVIQKGDSFLMVKEFKPSAAGKWGLPGGKVEEGESLYDTVKREVQEETGYTVTVEKLLSITNKPKTHEGNTVIRFVFQCELYGQPTSTGEHEHQFLTVAEVEKIADQGLIRGQEVVPILKKAAVELAEGSDDLLEIL